MKTNAALPEKPGGSAKTGSRQLSRLLLVVAAHALYMVAGAMAIGHTGLAIAIISFVPASVTALAYGLVPGLTAGLLLLFIETPFVISFLGYGYLEGLLRIDNLVGGFSIIVICAIMGLLRDLRVRLRAALTTAHAAREALQVSREKYRRIVEGLRRDHFFYTHDVNSVFTYLSPSIADVLGYPVEEFLKNYAEFLTDDPVNNDVIAHTEQSILGNPQPPYEVDILHKDGGRRRLEVSETPVFDESGRVTAVEGIAHDITARWKAERARAESEAGFRSMFEATSEGVALISPRSGQFIAANPAMRAMFGYTEGEFLSLTPEDITPTEAKEQMRSSMQRLFDGKSVSDHEGVSISRSGARINVIISNRSISWNGEKVFHVTFKDVTSLKKIQSQLEERNRAILSFTNMITHDLRNPLSGIKVMLGLLQDTPALRSDADTLETIGLGVEAAQYMESLISDLLDVARLETGTKCLSPTNTNVRDVVNRALSRIKPQTREKSIAVIVDLDDIEILADPGELMKVFMNLIGNAVAYIGKGPDPHITIGMTLKDEMPTIFVRDTGIGIPVENLTTIFDKFKRGSNVGAVKGTGLGLAIVKGIVQAHGGTVWVESEVGKGTTFFFTLAGGLDDTLRE